MTDLELAVIEWRDAREAFFALPPLGNNPKDRIPPEILVRLSNAEHRLMDLARQVFEPSDPVHRLNKGVQDMK